MSEDALVFAEENRQLKEDIARLKEELDLLKRHIFGKKSERFIAVPGQLSFDGLDIQVPVAQAPVT